ncbi:MAG: 16S rRNA (uracil(1498)-N(3))-methyltransferase [Deltaproteobacteria bacterium]|nr:16S rRNA (uracil(1498)-N(3))-methyltransferase [Deltaproteobacteria bacterium]
MTIPRLYLPRPLEMGAVCSAAADQARYLKTVLRMKEGDPLLIFNGTDWEYEAVIRRQTAEGMELEITGRQRLPETGIHVTLCQAVPKAEKMDGIVRHATELGAERIVPFLAERSVPRWRPEQLPRKRERWQRIAAEASRQCGRSDIPEVGEIVTFERMLRDAPESGLRLIPWEEETTTGIREVLRDPARAGMTEFVLVIGPEGGFSAGEIDQARRAGFLSVSLGKRVLRVETASLAVIAVLQYEKGGRETESTA